MSYLKKALVYTVLSLAFVLAGCATGAKENNGDQPSADTAKQKAPDLKTYSLDKNIRSEEDFDLIGKYVHAEDDQITLEIKDKELIVPKSSRFHSEEDHDDLIGKLVKVEVDGKTQEAEEAELMPQSKADQNGVYEQEKDGSRKIIATFVSESEQNITIKTKAGEKTYQKTADFERDVVEAPEKLKGKIVRLEIEKDGKAESLDFESEDQKLEWYEPSASK